MEYKKIYLKDGKDFPIVQGHPWIFSGAIERKDAGISDGEIIKVHNKKWEFIAWGYYNSKTSIACRVFTRLAWGHPLNAWRENMKNAFALRKSLFDDTITNCYRLINAEADFLPWLIVDKYADTLVVQISTAGVDAIKDFIIETLEEHLSPKCIFENSDTNARKIDGLTPFVGKLKGELSNPMIVMENKMKFTVNLEEGQKTGFFLDQREERALIGRLSKWKKVLNCFCFSGGFSLAARIGWAEKVVSIDISKKAIEDCKTNYELNHISVAEDEFIAQDVFKYIENTNLSEFDIIILDPPAFAKKKEDKENAIKWYKWLNAKTMAKMKSWSILLTCSCSYYIDSDTFEETVRRAWVDAKKNLKVLGRHLLAHDHPISLSQKESEYIKGLLLSVN